MAAFSTTSTPMPVPPIPRHIVIKHEGNGVEISPGKDGSNADNDNQKPTMPLNLPLVDEIDLQQCLISPAQPWRASSIQGVVIGKEKLEVICKATGSTPRRGNGAGQLQQTSAAKNAIQACPCCRRYIQIDSGANIASGDECNGIVDMQLQEQQPQLEQQNEASDDTNDNNNNTNECTTFTSLVQAAVTTLTMQPTLTLMQPMAAPPLVAGDQLEEYTIVETIVQGWLYKKGTGGDFSGRRWWKPRWVTLALAENPNTITPLPILLSHRAPGVPYPASIVELTESTVIMAIERTHEVTTEKGRPSTPTKEEWNRHCFQIVHTHHQNNESTPKTTTRIFTAPAEDRNEWVYVMNQALMSYEKRLSNAAKKEFQHAMAAKQQTKKARHSGLVLDNDGWTGAINPSGAGMRSLSPVCGAATPIGLPPTGRMRSPSPIRSRSITPVQI